MTFYQSVMRAGLLSVVNPIGAIPTFISLTINRTLSDRKRTAIVCAAAVAMVLFIALLAGEPILRFFGISLPAFRVAGGILVLLMGISMLRATHDPARYTSEERSVFTTVSNRPLLLLQLRLLPRSFLLLLLLRFHSRPLDLLPLHLHLLLFL